MTIYRDLEDDVDPTERRELIEEILVGRALDRQVAATRAWIIVQVRTRRQS